MTPFPLKILTPEGLRFDGQAEALIVRTVTGDMGILAGHTDCLAPLGMGRAAVLSRGQRRFAACIGGMVNIADGAVTLIPTTFEWAGDIDLKRAERAAAEARAVLGSRKSTDAELRLAQARLKRALVRADVAGHPVSDNNEHLV